MSGLINAASARLLLVNRATNWLWLIAQTRGTHNGTFLDWTCNAVSVSSNLAMACLRSRHRGHCVVLVASTPAGASHNPGVGDRLSLFPGPPVWFPGDTPFNVRHGWTDGVDIDDPTTRFDFYINGVQQVGIEDKHETTKAHLYNFPAGLEGSHVLRGEWYDAGFLAVTIQETVLFATCHGEPATMVGTNGDDHLFGTAGKDVVVALAGKDFISTFGGNDHICAGAGKDEVHAGAGNDQIWGQGGKDEIAPGEGDDKVNGGAGAGDTVTYNGTAFAVTADLSLGTATYGVFTDKLSKIENIVGSDLPDDLTGDAKANKINGAPARTESSGGGGGGAGADTLLGSFGRDNLKGNGGGDVIKGGKGNDRMFGGKGGDTLTGGGGANDKADGGPGTDTCDAEVVVACP